MLQHVFNGLVGGSFLALVALGLAVIFGMLRVVNFAHGAIYMLGAFGALALTGEAFWAALVVVPVGLGLLGMVLERTVVNRLARLDPLYNFLLTFGLTLVLQDLVKWRYGVQSSPYPTPAGLGGSVDFGLFDFPAYRVFVLVVAAIVCFGVWFLLSRTRLGLIVRACTERPELSAALGVNVGRWVTPVFGFGVALAGLAGVLAAPMRAVHPLMGADLIIVVFAVVVIGGLGSIFGSVAAAFAIGVLQALSEAYLDSALVSQILVYVVMAAVLLWRPSGLFGREESPA
ncbi:branched-chain amino acid ABC transporter permease [Rhizocola hellebori]|uniref:Branched-chain amino acid ABC transporter permease n=1 Tax=Rhizocola hellebori TaxID=1392758 RepID=A0A8J3VHB2_9ACTN|nr:branched-chain amino acid ABC transporter permease [Rhizocola hellebori]GIH06325.1 branched-chain amino acid ABC transporter permease [Rhizocola hellebori]